MSARPKKAKSAHTFTEPRVPIGLQITARWLAGMTADADHLRESLRAADGLAVRILTDPLTATYDEGAAKKSPPWRSAWVWKMPSSDSSPPSRTPPHTIRVAG